MILCASEAVSRLRRQRSWFTALDDGFADMKRQRVGATQLEMWVSRLYEFHAGQRDRG